MEQVQQRVVGCVEDILCTEAPLESHIIKDLGADSLDCIEIAMELEKEFGITIPDEDMEKHWTTVQEIVSYMENRVSNK